MHSNPANTATPDRFICPVQREVYAGRERLEQFTDRTGGGYERLLYVHEDLQGNTRYYTKENGNSFAELTYDAWGMPVSPNKLLNNDHGNYVYATYTGHIFDTTLDIYFCEARFYDANTRQWMAMDPIRDGRNGIVNDLIEAAQDFIYPLTSPQTPSDNILRDHVFAFFGVSPDEYYLIEAMVGGAAVAGAQVVNAFGLAGSSIGINEWLSNKSGSLTEGGGATSRPTWRQSELDAATDFPDYDAQKSFINGEEVPYGTKGSVRPDYYKDGFSVDIKNYNVESERGRSNLVRNIEKQYYQRIENLPNGTKQSVMIDVRGQNVSDAALNALYDDIMQRTNNGVEILFKMD